MNRDHLLRLLGLWEQGFRSHAAAELLESGGMHHVARFAAQVALDFGSTDATLFCEMVERWDVTGVSNASESSEYQPTMSHD